MKQDEIVPAATTPTGAVGQRGYQTPQTKALWRLVQAAAKNPGDALASTSLEMDPKAAIQLASRIRRGKIATVEAALKQASTTGRLEAWAEENFFGHTVAVRFMPNMAAYVPKPTYAATDAHAAIAVHA